MNFEINVFEISTPHPRGLVVSGQPVLRRVRRKGINHNEDAQTIDVNTVVEHYIIIDNEEVKISSIQPDFVKTLVARTYNFVDQEGNRVPEDDPTVIMNEYDFWIMFFDTQQNIFLIQNQQIQLQIAKGTYDNLDDYPL
jgi:hypothetical protein